MVYLNIPLAALFRLLYTTHHKTVTHVFDFDLVILEVSTVACRTDDFHLRRCGIRIDDFDGATNARDLNARSRRQLIRLVNLVALVESRAAELSP